ncbi:hypothetical protein BED47_00795 [Gottfriedia luciferensis]|uniref:Siphovirus-type tail component C-terminal domain-containing protein n=1 Tax=Gottfriedia luciferensis TaxID=178774 RepID=A0ABX2ZWK4_9BACI|nr:phage tail domain-containing protein [Gottfriedia luciferensis]ODG93739.1 hypothetical protein BED47_00795 [Gottfriedia luciferensis]
MKIDRITWYSSTGESIEINRSGTYRLKNKLQTSGLTASAYTTKSYMQHGQTFFNSVYDPADMELDFLIMKVQPNSVANFEGKITTSVTENPHIFWTRLNQTTLATPSQISDTISQGAIDSINKLDGNTDLRQTTTTNAYGQQIFSFNLIKHLEKRYGVSIWNGKTALSDKIIIAKQIVTNLSFQWFGRGFANGTNKATLRAWSNKLSTWNYAQSHTDASVQLLNIQSNSLSFIDMIDSNGFVHYLANSEAYLSSAASQIYTDYVELNVTIDIDILEINARRTVSKLFAPHLGTGTLWITLEDGSQYARDCHVEVAPLYPTGFENDNLSWQNVAVELTADNPFWYTAEQTITPSSASFTITNNGDVPTGIRLQFISTNGTCTIKNNTTGEFVKIGSVLNLSKIYMNTNQGQEWVENPDGVGTWSTLDPGSTLFKLVPGANSITINGTTPTQINAWYRERYSGI